MNFKLRIFQMILLAVIAIQGSAQEFNKKLNAYTQELAGSIGQIDAERKEKLNEIAGTILSELKEDNDANLLVICTHNSRRSHLGQVWLHTASLFYGVEGIRAFSGGTEATAFNENAVEALKRVGFVVKGQKGENPRYEVVAGSSKWVHYSKKYTDMQNPESDFIALMVCSEADKSCPVVKGADARFSLPYDDPRYFDGTPSQELEYDNTVRLIGQEMFYLISKVKEMQVNLLEAAR